MTSAPHIGLRRCDASVRVLFGPQRRCSNPASRRICTKLLCERHSRGETVKVTIQFEQNVLDGIEASKLVLAVKRSILPSKRSTVTMNHIGGPIVDSDGTVLGQWKAEQSKRKAA